MSLQKLVYEGAVYASKGILVHARGHSQPSELVWAALEVTSAHVTHFDDIQLLEYPTLAAKQHALHNVQCLQANADVCVKDMVLDADHALVRVAQVPETRFWDDIFDFEFLPLGRVLFSDADTAQDLYCVQYSSDAEAKLAVQLLDGKGGMCVSRVSTWSALSSAKSSAVI